MIEVKNVTVTMSNGSVKEYDPKECCAVFWGPKGREFYVLAIQHGGFSIEDQKERYDRLNRIDAEAVINQEELVFGKDTRCCVK